MLVIVKNNKSLCVLYSFCHVSCSVSDPDDLKKNNLTCFTCDDSSSAVCNKTVQCVGDEDRCISGTGEPSWSFYVSKHIIAAFKVSISCWLNLLKLKKVFCHPQWKVPWVQKVMPLDVSLEICVKVFLTWRTCLVPSLFNHQNAVEAASVTQPGLSKWMWWLCCLDSLPLSAIRTKRN